jgi:hypothetical protein
MDCRASKVALEIFGKARFDTVLIGGASVRTLDADSSEHTRNVVAPAAVKDVTRCALCTTFIHASLGFHRLRVLLIEAFQEARKEGVVASPRREPNASILLAGGRALAAPHTTATLDCKAR